MAANAILLKFAGDTTSLEAAFKRVSEGTKTVGDTADKTSGRFKALGGAAKIAAVAVAGMGVELVKGAVESALKAQAAQGQLSQALKNAGIASDKTKEKLEQYADSQTKRGFSDIDATQSLSRLVIATHNARQATQLNSTAEDLARAKSISLGSATDMLIRLHAGNTRALKALGIVINPINTAVDKLKATTKKYTPEQLAAAKATDKQTTAQKGLVALMQATHGQADKFASTDAGKIQVFKAEWEHLQAQLGNVLLPILGKVLGAVSSLMDFIDSHKRLVEILAGVIGGLAAAVWGVNAAVKAYTAVQEALNLVMDANPVLLVVTAIAALAAGFAIAWDKSKTFRDIVKGAFDDVKAAAQAVADFFTQDIPAAFDTIAGAFSTVKDTISGYVDGLVGFVTGIPGRIASVASTMWDAISGAFNAVKGVISGIIDAIVGFVTAIPGRIAGVASGMWDAISGALGTVKDRISGYIGDIVGFVTAIPGKIGKAVSGMWDVLKAGLGDVVGAIEVAIAPIVKVVDGIKSTIDAIMGWFSSGGASHATQALANITAGQRPGGIPTVAGRQVTLPVQGPPAPHALGGIFTRPHLGMVAEAGPEAIIPLNRPGRAASIMAAAGLGGGSTVVHAPVINVSALDATGVEKAVVVALQRYYRRNGAIGGVAFK